MTRMKIIHNPEDIPNFASDQEASDFWDHHSLAPGLWAEAGRGEGADPELDAILARWHGTVSRTATKPASKPLRLEKKVRAALNRQAEQQGKTPDELVNEVLKKALKVS